MTLIRIKNMKKGKLYLIENEIVQLIQAKNQMRISGKLNCTVETVLNDGLIDAVGKLQKILRKKMKTESRPAFFSSPPQQPPKPIEFYF